MLHCGIYSQIYLANLSTINHHLQIQTINTAPKNLLLNKSQISSKRNLISLNFAKISLILRNLNTMPRLYFSKGI